MLGGPIIGFNTVINESRELIFASFGDVVKSHIVAVKFAQNSCEVNVGRKFSTVLTSAAGYPLDKTYYQTVKGMVTPLDILQEGGNLIIVSECSEGLGSKSFFDSQKRLLHLGEKKFYETIKGRTMAEIDEWQTEMQMRSMRVGKIKLFAPALKKDDRILTGVDVIEDITESIAESINIHDSPEIAVIPEGPYVIPFSRIV